MTHLAPAVQPRRRYLSVLRADRAAQTRRRILHAAHQLFVERGYAATTMRDIAGAAEVSVAAVEQSFGTKRRLLKEAVDVAIAGDDAPVAMLDRPWAHDAVSSTDLEPMVQSLADVLAAAQSRSAGLIAAAYEAAARDTEIAELVSTLESNRSGTAGWLVARIGQHRPLVAGMSRRHAVDVVWTLIDPVVFLRLTGTRGWTVQNYRDWIAQALVRQLTDRVPASRPIEHLPEVESAVTDHHLPKHGQLSYLQLPATDIAASASFYQRLFGWQGSAGFEAPGLIGQWIDDRPAQAASGPLLWIWVDDVHAALSQVPDLGGVVLEQPYLDGGERWLATVRDPAGTTLGLVQAA